MNKSIKFFCGLFSLIALMSLSTGCDNDVYDEHYNAKDARLDVDINGLIASDNELSDFNDLLKETGFDIVLSNAQAYTVWAPTNDALSSLSSSILNDSVQLKDFVGNHISLFSYSSTDALNNDLLIKMMNGKYVEFDNQGSLTFADAAVVEDDFLTSNGIVHKISSFVEVKNNIWNYLNYKADMFPALMSYLNPFTTIVFDADASTPIGQNSLGSTVYDSVFVESNSYFDVVGNLNSEEERFTFIGLTDDVYAIAFDSVDNYFQHPDSALMTNNVNKVIYDNLNFPELKDYAGGTAVNTNAKTVSLPLSAIQEDVPLSNGNLLVLNDYTFKPEELFYVPIRYEIENSDRLTISDFASLTIKKVYETSASGDFYNTVKMIQSPNPGVNDYFDVEFSNVMTSKYQLKVKFVPVSGDIQNTRVRFDLSYNNAAGEITTSSDTLLLAYDIDTEEVIGEDFYTFPVFVDDNKKNEFFVKLRVTIDVAEVEEVAYNRVFGIDYIELDPVQ